MLTNPDLKPSASINCWILSILIFHFTLVHPGNIAELSDDFDDWVDNVYGFLHLVNLPSTSSPPAILATYPNNIAIDADTQDTPLMPTISYRDVPHSDNDHAANHCLEQVHDWHKFMECPSTLSDAEYTTFLCYCTEFFITSEKLWRKDSHGHHKLIAFPDHHIAILTSLHDEVAHKGIYVTTALIALRFWWPMMRQDITWFIVSDNGSTFIKALTYLAKKYHVQHICISGYNSHANGITERSHFDVHQALFKAIDGDQSKWNCATYSIFWADHITVRHCMGCLPYFAATGTHPLVPLDIAEATYLLPPPSSFLSSTDLIAATLSPSRNATAMKFKCDHIATIYDFNFQPGALILMRYSHLQELEASPTADPEALDDDLTISQDEDLD
ncbi:hypothetical protein EW146_g9925 [Bondarzewia mesenterica]|uniref:Integrase zinc-binding domain-containing protein n=1 Tax=Bondarzewia mesenterica TaxID=1095465 RepID=A0A4S4L1Z9_9AGAM|nr:hypothetical protein EW146_g9925 [Bondarzewia mesenterica]